MFVDAINCPANSMIAAAAYYIFMHILNQGN